MAIFKDLQTNKATMHAPKEAQHELNTELAFWAVEVDEALRPRH